MASVQTLVRMKRAGVYHPPGSIFHDFDLDEAEALKGKLSILDRGDPLAPASDPIAPADDAAPEPVTEPEGENAPPDSALPAQESGGAEGRVAEVMEAFDLLDEGDWTQGGRPRVRALSSILGFQPTADEIDAALSLREAMQ
ncbi:hypothetical protein PMNALOAF_2754 [Methylobacterium adhaesivum]|uniref:hypothetical protein n=1 Tax=Methylobacterium adhaesivum TaxID=333297 RepID=UPI001EDF906A|nr:hypothetical protein [Methylobacterium adhaesivum]GJD31495.1 hypothetical protein PMNALOAF_2754 [Methylobacterium adhaesivum]